MTFSTFRRRAQVVDGFPHMFLSLKRGFPFSGSRYKTETSSLVSKFSEGSDRQRTQTIQAIFKLSSSKYNGKLLLWKFLLRLSYTVDLLHNFCNNPVFRWPILSGFYCLALKYPIQFQDLTTLLSERHKNIT